jgi:hypothetical protein
MEWLVIFLIVAPFAVCWAIADNDKQFGNLAGLVLAIEGGLLLLGLVGVIIVHTMTLDQTTIGWIAIFAICAIGLIVGMCRSEEHLTILCGGALVVSVLIFIFGWWLLLLPIFLGLLLSSPKKKECICICIHDDD